MVFNTRKPHRKMSVANEIVNRVSNSPLITFNLEDYYQPGERCLFDISELLFQGLVLKEKDFREFVKNHDWGQYKNKFVAITCSTDAIVPTWAYMLIAVSLRPHTKEFCFGNLERLEEKLFEEKLVTINWNQYAGKKVVVKGCSKVHVPVSTYLEAVKYLQQVAASLMFGEPCSTVPLYKQAKSLSQTPS